MRALTVLTVGVLLAACSKLVELDGLTGGKREPEDAGVHDASPADGAMPGDATLPPEDGATPPDADMPDAGNGCPDGEDLTRMVRIEAEGTSFCVDQHEVTQEQYRDFLESQPDLDALYRAAACAGVTDIKPNVYPPAPASLKLPVVEIPYCGAEAYCAFAGKELCGAIAGGAVRFDLASSPTYGALARACAGDTTRKFAYGDLYDAEACNGNDFPGGGTVPVASVSTCVTPDTDIFDLSGNVWEWIDACESDTGATDSCYAQGGAFNSPETELSCDAPVHYAQRVTKDPTVGFRCCAY